MTGKSRCRHCNALIVTYKHMLTPGLVGALIRFAEHGSGPVNLGNTDLSRSQLSNFQKLRYFRLVTKVGPGTHSGIWEITEFGRKFLAGEALVSRYIKTFRGNTTKRSKFKTTIHNIHHEPYYMKHEDYVMESEGVT